MVFLELVGRGSLNGGFNPYLKPLSFQCYDNYEIDVSSLQPDSCYFVTLRVFFFFFVREVDVEREMNGRGFLHREERVCREKRTKLFTILNQCL